MADNSPRYGRVVKGHTIPYGTFVGAPRQIINAYYTYNYLHDKNMPELLEMDPPVREDTNPEEVLFRKEFAAQIEEILSTLRPREKKVLCMRFGIGLDTDYSLEEIGATYDVTRERIRQIEARAARKLKSPYRGIDQYRGIL